jgi:hypothetical protein
MKTYYGKDDLKAAPVVLQESGSPKPRFHTIETERVLHAERCIGWAIVKAKGKCGNTFVLVNSHVEILPLFLELPLVQHSKAWGCKPEDRDRLIGLRTTFQLVTSRASAAFGLTGTGRVGGSGRRWLRPCPRGSRLQAERGMSVTRI